MESTLSRFRTDSNFVPFFLGAIMGYFVPMELQTQMEKLETSLNRQKIINIALAGVAGVAVFFAVKPHGIITCDGWRVAALIRNLPSLSYQLTPADPSARVTA